MRQHVPATVAEVMNRSFWSLSPDSSLDEAEAVMARTAARHWPVTRGRRLLGTISLADLMSAQRWLPADYDEHPSITAARLMDRSPFVARPQDALATAARVMLRDRLSLVPVVDDVGVVGVVTLTDFVRLAIRLLRQDADDAGELIPVAALMSPAPLVTARPRETLAEVEQRMRRAQVRHVPVVDGDRIVGILSDRDVLAALRSASLQWPQKISLLMTPSPFITTTSSDAIAAAILMLRRSIGALPVTDDDHLRGMLTKTDYLGYLVSRTTDAPKGGQLLPRRAQHEQEVTGS